MKMTRWTVSMKFVARHKAIDEDHQPERDD